MESLYPLNNNSSTPGDHHSMNLTILGASCKKNHTIFVFLCLTYFTWQNVFKVHLCCSLCQHFILLKAEWYFLVFTCHILFTCSSIQGHFSWFHLLLVMNNTAVYVYKYRFGSLFSIWVEFGLVKLKSINTLGFFHLKMPFKNCLLEWDWVIKKKKQTSFVVREVEPYERKDWESWKPSSYLEKEKQIGLLRLQMERGTRASRSFLGTNITDKVCKGWGSGVGFPKLLGLVSRCSCPSPPLPPLAVQKSFLLMIAHFIPDYLFCCVVP
jgi:hypothetical protein